MNTVTSWFNLISENEREKLKADPFYYSMMRNGHSYTQIKKSGWINHSYSLCEMEKLRRQKITQFASDDVFILINTGSYAPAHKGHFDQLRIAQRWVSENHPNYKTILCLSPSHDKYVLSKSENIKNWNINNRVKYINHLIKEWSHLYNEEFYLDLWESCICEYPVNFTDVIIKIANDLKKLHINFKIGYVFGSDNEDFIYPFTELDIVNKSQYFAFCIERNNHPITLNVSSSNLIYLKNTSDSFSLSSSFLRKFQNDEKYYINDIADNNKSSSLFAVRKDNSIALKNWIEKYPKKQNALNLAYNQFHIDLCKIIEKYCSVKTISIDIEKQLEIVKNIQKKEPVINLDIGTNYQSEYKIDYTRLFKAGSNQIKAIKLTNRPEVKISSYIPPGEYSFIDDDIASGQTFEKISLILSRKNIILNKKYSLAQLFLKSNNIENSLYDIVDTKDFLVGSYSGGLLCEIYKEKIRLPYFYQFVDLLTRVSISPHNWLMFQNEILKINKKFFRKIKFLNRTDFNPFIIDILEDVNIDTNFLIKNIK